MGSRQASSLPLGERGAKQERVYLALSLELGQRGKERARDRKGSAAQGPVACTRQVPSACRPRCGEEEEGDTLHHVLFGKVWPLVLLSDPVRDGVRGRGVRGEEAALNEAQDKQRSAAIPPARQRKHQACFPSKWGKHGGPFPLALCPQRKLHSGWMGR